MKYLTLLAIPSVLAATQAQAADPIERYTYTYVTPGSADFSASSFLYNNTVNFDTVAGSIVQTINFQSVAKSIVIYGQGGTVPSVTSLPDFTPSQDVTFTSPGGTGQGYGFDYTGVATATAGLSFLTYGVVNGHYALTFTGGGTNLVDNGGRFFSSVVIDGNWSDAASRTLASFDPGYSIDQNFIYDSVSNKTTFTIETTNYQANNPTISFSLLGALAPSVPEPATWAMMIVGFGAIGASLRRRRTTAFA